MRDYQKLKTPQLVELEAEIGFVIVTEIDVSEMRNKLIFMKGDSYNYEDGILSHEGLKEIQYSMNEDGYHDIDDKGNIISF